eukprot:TRINITY_DN10839_c0_g4_i1.p1 TRINITY_DN10839_c0_g4~~TRINITY_DN10839_c0_g4_i1.p1  ORF type:complete len:614 (+),score=123.56 TRINITY_DN10839_c0_g4_i1:83-1843(+)
MAAVRAALRNVCRQDALKNAIRWTVAAPATPTNLPPPEVTAFQAPKTVIGSFEDKKEVVTPTLQQYQSSDADKFAEVREVIERTIHANKFLQEGGMNFQHFTELMAVIAPAMHFEEVKALFVSMDTSHDGLIQSKEIYSDIALNIIRQRIGDVEPLHPLEGSYASLPRPPFHADPVQLQAIQRLKEVFDEVVAASSSATTSSLQFEAKKKDVPFQNSQISVFASLFGGIRRQNREKDAKREVAILPPAPKPNAPKGAYLYGGCGTGKTVLLDLFFRSLPAGFSARRLHWHEFIRDAFRSMQGHPPGHNIFEAMGAMMGDQFRVLLLDELHITHISEAILVKNLFRQLWARGVTVITTSNYRPEELFAKGFNREKFEDFIPELSEQCPVVDMCGKVDYRRDGASIDQAFFFYPMGDETQAAMDRAFETQAASEIIRDKEIPIERENRGLRVRAQSADVGGGRIARFTFEDLCAQNTGRADYSAIAEKYHTIFLDNVPVWTADLGAEFRRFVSLVDILYSKKVLLFLSSEVQTDQLFDSLQKCSFADIDELWACRRCTSMLSEMQTPKYRHMVWLMRNHLLQENAMHL